MIAAPTKPARRVEPTVSLLQGKAYTPAANTNLRELFDRLRAELKEKQQ